MASYVDETGHIFDKLGFDILDLKKSFNLVIRMENVKFLGETNYSGLLWHAMKNSKNYGKRVYIELLYLIFDLIDDKYEDANKNTIIVYMNTDDISMKIEVNQLYRYKDEITKLYNELQLL